MKPTVKFHGIELKSSYRDPSIMFFIPDSSDKLERRPYIMEEGGTHKITTHYNNYLNGEPFYDNDQFYRLVKDLFPITIEDFNHLGTSRKSWNKVLSYNKLIDLHTVVLESTPDSIPNRALKRIVFHGEACRVFDLNYLNIFASLNMHRLYPQRIDLNIDVSADFAPFSKIEHHFRNDLLTKNSSYNSYTDAGGNRSWYVGGKPSDGQHGYRISFYESAKRHPELPKGSWRIELQMYGREAQIFVDNYISDPTQEFLDSYFRSKLKTRLQFRTESKDLNKSRWPITKWWAQVIAGAGNFSEHKKETMLIREGARENKLLQDMKSDYDRVGADMYYRVRSRFDEMTIGPF